MALVCGHVCDAGTRLEALCMDGHVAGDLTQVNIQWASFLTRTTTPPEMSLSVSLFLVG